MKPPLRRQLEHLRRRIRRIENAETGLAGAATDATVADTLEDPADSPENGESDLVGASSGDPEHYDAEQFFDGQVIESPWGRYFLTEKFYPSHARHGCLEISELAAMPAELLEGVSRGQIPGHDPHRWAFLDTETTGLAGGTGTCAFLVGVGTIEDGGFRVRLFFMRDYDEERAMLSGLSELLQHYDVLVTYNGKAYDSPLLETRYRLARQRFPLERLHHLDLLHGARQLWKLRMENCRLIQLESEILGVLREGDLPGEMIPYYYFEYLRTRQAFRLAPLFHHNVLDIVSLACLSAVVLPAFSSPEDAPLRHGHDLLGLARWLRRCGQLESARTLYRRALKANLREDRLFAALWETAQIEKRLGRREEAVRLLRDLTGVPNRHRAEAYEELAKHCEHRQKDYLGALDHTQAALAVSPSPALLHRKTRLERKISRCEGAKRELFA